MAQNIDLSAPTRNLVIEQGTSVIIPFAATIEGEPLDMTGFLIRAQVRMSYGNTNVLINLTQANGKLVFTDITKGKWNIVLLPSDTNASSKIRFGKEDEEVECVYDMQAVSPTNQVFPIVKGSLTIARSVTRV